MVFTLLLGLLFVDTQIFEFNTACFHVNDAIYGNVFFSQQRYMGFMLF